jgi:AraC-like DNA-binding protein
MPDEGHSISEQELVALDFGSHCDALRGLRLSDRKLRTNNSTVFMGVAPATGKRFAVKRVTSTEQASLEFESLSRLSRLLPYQAPVAKPVCLLAEQGLLVSEWIDGRSIRAILRDHTTSFKEARRVLGASGRWLRDFHAVQAHGPAPLELQKKFAQLDDLCAKLAGRWIRQRLLGWMRRRLHATARLLPRGELPRADLHGDFKPENLLADGDRVVGIDIGHIYRSCTWNDVAYFLAQMEWAVCSRPNLRLLPRIPGLRRAFLEGYGVQPDEETARLLHWLEREVLFRFAYAHLSRSGFGLREAVSVALTFIIFLSHGRPRRGGNTRRDTE